MQSQTVNPSAAKIEGIEYGSYRGGITHEHIVFSGKIVAIILLFTEIL